MPTSQVTAALDRLRVCSLNLLSLSVAEQDLTAIEQAVADRETAICQVSDLVTGEPDRFTIEDLQQLRACLAAGKTAYERIVISRARGWSAATALSRNQYILRAMSPQSAPVQ